MKKVIAFFLAASFLLSVCTVSFTASADRILAERQIFEIEALDSAAISYYPGAVQDFYAYGNGVSGSYIRVENTAGVVGNYVEFTLDVAVAGNYTVSYAYRVHPISGTNQLYINGTPVGEPRDFNNRLYGGENDMAVFQAENISLPVGENTFRLETVALSDNATYQGTDRITVDYIKLMSTNSITVGYTNRVVYVSDMNYFDLAQFADPDHLPSVMQGQQVSVFQPGGTLSFDTCSCGKQPILLDGVEYTKGFGLEPSDKTAAVLEIPIPAEAERFQTVVGLNDHKQGSIYDQKNVVTFSIDGLQVYQTEPLTFGHCETIDIPIPYGAETLTIRNDCGISSENDHICFGDARFDIGDANDVSLEDFAIEGGTVLTEGRNIFVLLPEGTDLTALVPEFTVCGTSSCAPAAGIAQDFTQPVTYTVTARDGQTAAYTVTVYVQREWDAEELSAIGEAEEAIARISQPASMSDRQAVLTARALFTALDGREKLAVSNYALLTAAEEAVQALLDDPIKIACVGDSITYGGVAEKSYPVNLQEILGEDYWVYNAGVGGTTASKNGIYPYWSTAAYPRSKSFGPDYVLIMLGTNDGADWGTCKSRMEQDYRELIAQYDCLPSRPTIVLASPAWYYLETNAADAINDTISKMVEQLAEEYGLAFVDINAVTENHPEWFTRDGIHPDDDGYRAIAEAFAQVFSSDSDATLQTAKLGDTVLADFSGQDQVTVQLEEAVSPQEILLTANGTVQVETQTQEAETAMEITVTSPNGRYRRSYTLTLLAPEIPGPGQEELLPGDMNQDGALSVTDVVLLRKTILTNAYSDIGDMNQDESLSVTDVVLLRKKILEQPT